MLPLCFFNIDKNGNKKHHVIIKNISRTQHYMHSLKFKVNKINLHSQKVIAISISHQ